MINITEKAKERMVNVLDDEGSTLLRFGLKGGGCSGFSYYFAVEEKKEEDDFEFQLDETHVLLVDAASNMYLENAEIDFKKDMMGENFVFSNPDVKHSCGCGSSVSF